MRRFWTTTPGTRVLCALGTTIALTWLLLAAAPASSARTVEAWQAELNADKADLVRLEASLVDTNAEILQTYRDQRRALRRYQNRLATIYKAGGRNNLGTILTEPDGVGRATDMVDAMNAVARSDGQIVSHYRKLAAKLPKLQRKARRLQREVRKMRSEIRRDQRELREGLQARAAAELAAVRANRVPETPFVPRAVAPESLGARSGQPTGYTESGIASIYSTSFTGEETANGEYYDPGAMTAAHQTLPLGTWVQVSGPGGAVIVRINDRGPFVGGRIIDLSTAAAAAAGVNGLAHVTIRVIN